MPQGQGTLTRPDGQYTGQFKFGKKHGHGTVIFANGSKYVGQFRDNEYHGQGTMTGPGGEKYVGEWQDGKFVEVSADGSYPDLKNHELPEPDLKVVGGHR